jgi:Secretion system C-terminal sorting domain
MKKIYSIILFTIIGWSASAQIVNIPDVIFKSALIGNPAININLDTEIQTSEAAIFSDTINVNSLNISDLTGIEAFTSLRYLNCSFNQLFTLNVSSNTALKYLNCQTCQLTNLDLSHNILLTNLICSNNQFAAFDVSHNTALIHLTCGGDHLTSLNISANTNLTDLDCNGNELTSLNISNNIALTYLDCSGNQLTSLNISANTALTEIYCNDNLLNNFYVPGNTALTKLHCYSNQLTGLYIAQNTTLTNIYCSYNKLTSLDVSGATALQSLDCCFNLLTVLDVSSNAFLVGLGCNDSPLTSLNLKNGNNINFTSFYAVRDSNLTCIQVDDPISFMTNWSDGIDSFANYSLNCIITPSITFTNGVLTSSAVTGNIWCLDGTVISGATAQTYTPVANGVYTVQLKSAGNITSAASDSIVITNISTGIIQYAFDNNISVFPNPSEGKFTLQSATKISSIEITNAMGEIILSQKINADKVILDLSGNPSGIYCCRKISAE